MTIAVQDIVDRVTTLLMDEDRTDAHWSDEELIRWINDSRAAIVMRRPSACAKIENINLVAGAFQSLPADATGLFDIINNMGLDGNTPGRSIRRTDRQDLDDNDLNWQSSTQSSTISQYTYDDRTPKVFFVYPPAVAGTKVRASFPYMPPQVTGLNGTLNIDIEYLDAVVNYVCYRANSKDDPQAKPAEAVAYYGAFNDCLGVSQQGQASTSPNQATNSV